MLKPSGVGVAAIASVVEGRQVPTQPVHRSAYLGHDPWADKPHLKELVRRSPQQLVKVLDAVQDQRIVSAHRKAQIVNAKPPQVDAELLDIACDRDEARLVREPSGSWIVRLSCHGRRNPLRVESGVSRAEVLLAA